MANKREKGSASLVTMGILMKITTKLLCTHEIGQKKKKKRQYRVLQGYRIAALQIYSFWDFKIT